MADHLELVAEIPKVEKLSVQDRLELARKRRSQQLKRWERDKDVEFGPPPPKKKPQRARPVKFEPRIILLEAASRGDPVEVKKMLDYDVDPNLANDDGLTALHQACIDECEDIAMLLVEYGANINATDRELWTPLHAAAACGNLIMIEFLVDHGGDVAAINADGNLPVDLVEDDKEIKDFLYDEMDRKGFDEDKIDELMALREKWMLEDIKDAVEKKRDLEAKDLEGATALHVAAANGYVEVLEFLLENGADVDVTDKDGWMPIHAAGCWGNEKAIELLVEHGSELECKTPLGETPLDLCEDPDTRQFIVDLKNKIKTNKFKVKNTRRKRSNSRSLSVKRSSLKEKISISQGEAKAEAILRKHPELAFLIQNDKTNGVQKQMEVSMDEKDVNTEKHNPPEKTNVQVKDDWKPAPKELEVAERRVMTNSETDSEKTEGSGRKLVGIKVVLKGNEEKENIEPRSQGVQDKREEKSELNITDKMALDTVIPTHDNISTDVQAKNTTESRETVVQKQKTVEPSEKLSQKPSLPKVPPPRSTLGHRQLPANSPPHSPPITAKKTGMGKDNKLDQVLVISQPQRAPTTKPLSELISNKNIAQPSSTPKSTKTRAAPPVPRTSGSASGRSHIPSINSSADTSGYPDSFSKRKSRDSQELPEAAINQLAKDVKESRAVSSTDVKLSTQGTTARYTPLAPTPPQGPHDQVATLDVHSKTTNVLQPSAQTNNKNINNQPNEPAGRISAQDKVKVERHKKSCCTIM